MCIARFHIVAQDDQWRVATVGDVFKGPYPTKDEAIQAAQLLALLSRPSRVVIHHRSGDIEAETVYN